MSWQLSALQAEMSSAFCSDNSLKAPQALSFCELQECNQADTGCQYGGQEPGSQRLGATHVSKFAQQRAGKTRLVCSEAENTYGYRSDQS